jgi:hypothetical protein
MPRFSLTTCILPILITILVLAVPAEGQPSATINCGPAHAFSTPTTSRIQDRQAPSVEGIRSLVDELIATSYPELRGVEIQIKLLHDDADYFRTRFGIPQFLFGRRMHYLIRVNPKVCSLQTPEAGVRAILAHELAHVLYLNNRNRAQLLGLARLISKGFTARFERWTDLQAISRGYGEGLKEYRQWLYQHIPQQKLPAKLRNYFSPEEIDAILSLSHERPELLTYWLKHVPRNIKEIRERQSSPAAKVR